MILMWLLGIVPVFRGLAGDGGGQVQGPPIVQGKLRRGGSDSRTEWEASP
jgi:hypothetical protein